MADYLNKEDGFYLVLEASGGSFTETLIGSFQGAYIRGCEVPALW